MNVQLIVTGRRTADGQTEETVLELPGKLTALSDGWQIDYHQREEGQSIATRVTLRDGAMTVARSGDARSVMRLTPGRRQSGGYDTGYGILPMSVETTLLLCDMTPAGGRIEVRYRLTVGGMTADHALTIEVG